MGSQNQKRNPESDLDTTSRRDSSTEEVSPNQKRPGDMGAGKDLKDTPSNRPSDRKEQSSTKW